MVAGTETMNQSKDLLLKSLRAVLFGEKLDASDFAEADWKCIFQWQMNKLSQLCC